MATYCLVCLRWFSLLIVITVHFGLTVLQMFACQFIYFDQTFKFVVFKVLCACKRVRVISWAQENRRYADGLDWNRVCLGNIYRLFLSDQFIHRNGPKGFSRTSRLRDCLLRLIRLYDTFSHGIPFHWSFLFPLLIEDRHWQLHIKHIKSVDWMNANDNRTKNEEERIIIIIIIIDYLRWMCGL